MVFLLSLGVGLGSQIDAPQRQLGTVDYLSFVGPGLLAAGAMTLAAGESLWPTAAALRWRGNYPTVLATPISVPELVSGHLLWIGFRNLVSSSMYVLVLVFFGVVASPLAALAPVAAMLTGASFSAPISAWTAHVTNEQSFPLILRVGITPLFLFSGAFFPVDQLPGILPTVARVTPLWHGVRLCRGLVLGEGLTPASGIIHVSVLLAFVVAGWWACTRTFSGELAA